MKVQNKGGKGNPNHDEEGKFTTADDVGEKGEDLEVDIDNAINQKVENKVDDDDDVGNYVLAFDPYNFDDWWDSFDEGLTKGEKILKSREIAKENAPYLENTNYNENFSIEDKKSFLDVSSQEYDKEKIANLSKDEIEALYQAEFILNAPRQNEQKIAQLEDDKEKIEKKKDKQLKKYLIELQGAGYPVGAYGIWLGTVSLEDYAAKAEVDETGTSAIDRKRQYYEDIINGDFSFEDEIADAKNKLQNLNEWAEAGQKYLYFKNKLDVDSIDTIQDIETQIGDLKKRQEVFDSDDFKAVLEDNRKFIEIYQDKNAPYSKARKDAALWFQGLDAAYNYFSKGAKNHWKITSEEEQAAVKEYTGGGFSRFNKPLRGQNQSADGYSFGDYGIETFSIGVNNLTNAIDKCTWDKDIWLQRYIKSETKMFTLPGSNKKMALEYMTDEQLQLLVGTSFTDGGFFSCGAAKGTGYKTGPILFNVYCPKGVKMAYIAPYSSTGTFENEMLIQRGYTYKITKVERKGSHYYLDLEVILGSDENKPTGNKLKEIGNKHYYAPRGQKGENYD